MMCISPRADLPDLLSALRDYRPKTLPRADHRGSAILVPILAKGRGRLLYTLRNRNLKHHAGQFSFPGGVVEKGESGWQAAVREANEEVGLPRDHVRYLGRLDDVLSPRGFHVQCYAGLVSPFAIAPNQSEVERVIEVELAELFEPQRHEVKDWKGFPVHFFSFSLGLVWGVTGKITYQLQQTLRDEESRPLVK